MNKIILTLSDEDVTELARLKNKYDITYEKLIMISVHFSEANEQKEWGNIMTQVKAGTYNPFYPIPLSDTNKKLLEKVRKKDE